MSKKLKCALFLGRFQPFHRGHLSAIEAAFGEYDRLIIAIGSADKSRTKENPFTVGERHAMIKAALLELGYVPEEQFLVVPLTDIEDDSKWPKHLTDTCPQFDTIITSDPKVLELLKKSKKKIVPPVRKYRITDDAVRAAIERGDDLEKYMHEATVAFLQKIGAARKLVDIETGEV
jgi:nicotinamide-nucleotide adenylyltransferase